MAVPKKRKSKSVKGMHRSHHAIQFSAAVEVCDHCGENKLRHHVCERCGTYRGTQVIKAND